MKIRTGFVSNSSSSSFVVLGVEFDRNRITEEVVRAIFGLEEDDDIRDYFDGEGLKYADNDDDGASNGKSFIGVNVCDNEDWGLAAANYSVDEVITQLKPFIDKLPLEAKEKQLRIISGERAC